MTDIVPDTERAVAAATAAATETLLNCYLREAGGWSLVPASRATGTPLAAALGDGVTDVLAVPLRGGALTAVAGVRYRSATFRHRYAPLVRLAVGSGPAEPIGFPALAGLLLDELAPTGTSPPGALGAPASRASGGHPTVAGTLASPRDAPATADTLSGGRPLTLSARLVESLQAVAGFLEARRSEIDRLWSAGPLGFIESEQALLLGHPLHPTPKSRSEMSPRERAVYSPELKGSFPLHWLAATPDIVRHASATGTPAPLLARQLLDGDRAADRYRLDAVLVPLGHRVLVPAHPWELAHLREQAEVARLFDDGSLADLGPLGSPVTPTTSVRTVYQAGWPWQLKFSLHVSVTNSQRVTLPKELDRAVEAALFRKSPLGERAGQIAPAFTCVDDPAYLTIAVDGEVIDGFSVLLRENRWPGGSARDVTAVTTLCQDHPFGGASRLAQLVRRLASGRGISPQQAGRAWFERFCQVAVVSLVRLYLDAGLCFEAHQQNTLLELDGEGLPQRCVYRDSQGYFHREAAHDDICQVLPRFGEATESVFPEALADERLVYYPFLNLTLGVVNALGAGGCADEVVLLGDLRRCLENERRQGGRYPATLLDHLLDDPSWPCKGNLRTRLHDMDELVGDISTQSVYVTVPNPLALP